jgi:hypothetical protein
MNCVGSEKSTRGDSMLQRAIGAALAILGVFAVVLAPTVAVGGCGASRSTAHGPVQLPLRCYRATNSLAGLVNWPGGWERYFLPKLIIGIALVLTGVVLLIKPNRPDRKQS